MLALLGYLSLWHDSGLPRRWEGQIWVVVQDFAGRKQASTLYQSGVDVVGK